MVYKIFKVAGVEIQPIKFFVWQWNLWTTEAVSVTSLTC